MDKYAFEEAIKAYLNRADLSQAAAARKLHYTPEQFNKWVRGVNRIPDVAIQEISDLLDLNDEERAELFALAGYVAVTALKKEGDLADAAGESGTAAGSNQSIVSVRFGGAFFFIEALRDWSNHFFQWPEIPDHFRTNWTGIVIYSIKAITNRVTLRGLLTLCVSILLAIVTIKLLSPILLWPLNNVEERLTIYLQYALSTLLIPLLVASVSTPDRQNLFPLETVKQQMTVWFLKFAGALVGFWVFSVLVISLALALYYLHLPSLSAGIRAGLALIPLFFSYVVARRIPIDRYKMFNGQLQPHPADRLFVAVFIIVGPLTAFFLYFSYWFFINRAVAPIIILISLTGIFFWEYRKQKRVANKIEQ
jgi:hypothetical protein